MMDRGTGVRERGIPQFAVVLDHTHLMPDVWKTQLKPVSSVLAYLENDHVLQREGGRASAGLWTVLRTMPRAVARCEAPEFLLGYVPQPSVPVPDEDVALLTTWQNALGQCYRWSVTWQQDEAQPMEPAFIWGDDLIERRTRRFGPLFLWRDEFLALLDEIDAIVTPRIEFWYQQRQGDL